MSETWKETLAVEAHEAMDRLATWLPERWGSALFRAAGTAAFRLAPGARRTVQENLARVLGEAPGSAIVERTAREAFRSYARYWHETFLIRELPRERFLERFTVIGREHLDAAHDRGRGGLLALPHLGNWDAAGRWVAELGYRITAVAEELRPPRMYRLFHRHRRRLGMEIVPLSDARNVGQELASRLARNHFIALVCDRDLKGTGVEVEMFGERRKMPAGPALLSLVSGSPLFPCATFDTEDGWAAVIHPPLEIERTGSLRADVAELTRELARRFEREISAHPVQWHMFQPAWNGSPR